MFFGIGKGKSRLHEWQRTGFCQWKIRSSWSTIFFSILSLFFSLITFTLFSDSTEMVPSFCLCLRASLPGDPICLFLVVSATLPSEIVVVQSLSHVRLFVTPWTAICQASLSFTISQSLLKLMSIKSVIPSNHLILCHLLLFLPSIFPTIRIFSSESALHIRWPKYWSFNFSISPSNSGLISFRIDWFDLLAVQGTLKSHL